jgi:cell division protein FtsQ
VVVEAEGTTAVDGAFFEERYLAARLGQGIFDIDLAEVRQAVEADPWVKRAVVARVLPDRLRLGVRVRTAAAVVSVGRRSWLVDDGGVVILQSPTGSGGGLPRIRLAPSGRHWVERPEAIRRALRLLEATRRRRFPTVDEIRHLGFDERGDPVLVAEHGGIEIFLGRGNYGAKLDRLAVILADVAAAQQPVARIDLRFEDQVVVAGPGSS